MIDHLAVEKHCIYVYVVKRSLKTTKSFTHGGVVFDLVRRTVTFGKLPAVVLPDGLTLIEGATLHFQLMVPDGTQCKQTRSGVLRSSKLQAGMLQIAGIPRTPSKFSAKDGWGYAIYKYRAYFTHTGAKTDGEIPAWLIQSISRQRAFWNRLAYLCREARGKCSPVLTEKIIAFARQTILPELDAFNNSLDPATSREKIKHPTELKTEMPGLDSIWKFAGVLRRRHKNGRGIPHGLLEKIVAFAKQYTVDCTPMNEFQNSIDSIAAGEAKTLGLRPFEARQVLADFKAALKRRRTCKLPWSEGWPLIKHSDDSQADNWGLHYYFNQAGIDSALLESGQGVPGLTLGRALAPSSTGHESLVGVAAKRSLREAAISIPGDNGERWQFHFCVLQHRPLPPCSHLKEWKLIFQKGKLWLCFTVELQRPVQTHSPLAAGLDIGWKRTEEGIRFGTLYEPATKTIRELTIDLQKSPKDHKERVPFRIDCGPTRWEKRNMSDLFPDWNNGNPVPNSFISELGLQALRENHKNFTKSLLRKHLGRRLPAWFENTGRNGLLQIEREFKDDLVVRDILHDWKQQDEIVGHFVSICVGSITRRLEYGHAQVAHDICQYLQSKGTSRLIVETTFLSSVSRDHDNEAHISLKKSQKYRQFAAVGKFIAILRNITSKYGITVSAHQAINTTRVCQYCGHLNPTTEKEEYVCEKCERHIKQDQNAAVNLSRFGNYHEVKKMAICEEQADPLTLASPIQNDLLERVPASGESCVSIWADTPRNRHELFAANGTE